MSVLNKTTNDYAEVLNPALYNEIPKAVFAAIVVSALTNGGDWLNEADSRIAKEWDVLHGNGIVPQRPGKHARAALAAYKGESA
ncbi:MAG: hypothetical protein WKF61_00655 [Luteimonas sp.]